MRDVAEAAGVSTKTVSEVVNGIGQVRESTRRRVMATIEELGYQPNPAARRLNSESTGVLTLALPRLASGLHAALAAAVIEVAESGGRVVALEPTGGDPERELEILRNDSGVADGAILALVALGEQAGGAVAGAPVVLLGTRPLRLPFDQVVADSAAMTESAVALLRSHGRERVAILGTEELLSPHLPPAGAAGAAEAAKAGLRVAANALTRAAGYAAVDSLAAGGVPFDGLVALGDALAFGALHALRDRSLAVPADVEVIGIGRAAESAYSWPSLSTVEADVRDMAERAHAWLLERIAGETGPPRHYDVPFTVVERESTRPTG
ncbi:LacI family DNA-binding transcriptional regulator [Nonomuraea sp. K274]|uniref:LacI family DNA-binding transcriptional regulator n=2 Tax=Nonomuraea cypriaca TaxID=1187855 RepID=A0A931F0N0_9ACTN|nr:LacI family DNA-binding transcriptional regulator [Nonomuraea cypriaca]